jgi:hypothetical protein
MLTVGKVTAKNCQGPSREILQVGGLGALGLTLADGLRAGPAPGKHRPETSCIFIFLEGGPSPLETFDPKPAAPADVRGPYGTIPTSAPGVLVSEPRRKEST